MKTPVLESPFIRFAGFKVCNFLKKGLQHRCFPVNIAKFLRTLILMKICELLLLKLLLLTVNISFWVLVSALNSIVLLQRSSSRFKVLSGRLLSYLKKEKEKLAEIVTFCNSLYHSLSFVVTRCHPLSFVVIQCSTRCHSLYHSLSFVVIRCHSLSLVVTRCTTRCHSMYHSSVFYKRSSEYNETNANRLL